MQSLMQSAGWRHAFVWMIVFGACRLGAASDARPNLIVIMADDLGYGDVGCYGGKAFATPGIDRLAAEGMRLTDFHSSGCVCSPTRAGLLTGRYQQRAGVDGVIYAAFDRNRHHGLQKQEVTFAEVLKKAGYRTAIFGKWHLGYEEPYNPVYQGFEQFVGYVSGNVDYHTHIDGVGVFDWWHQNHLSEEPGYTTHLITQHACRFIRETVRQSSKPFCLYVAHQAPHDPYQGPMDPPVRRRGSGKPLYNHRDPAHATRAYAAMMRELDAGVSAILDTLQQTGVDQNTLILFFSDNGATGPGSCGGLYGMKGTLWEGGHRVPAIARWPGQIAAGHVSDQLATTLDVMPTLLQVAGVSTSDTPPLDGISLVPVLMHNQVVPARKIFWQYGDALSMRDGNWKLVLNGGRARRNTAGPQINWNSPDDGRNRVALFDLNADRNEQNNLARHHPERVAAMTKAIRAWQEDVRKLATAQPESTHTGSEKSQKKRTDNPSRR